MYFGVYLDAELSFFLPCNTNTAVGVGAGGGFYVDTVEPYRNGVFQGRDSFYGDEANLRLFINQTIPNPSPLPINLRATYGMSGLFYRETGDTHDFKVPDGTFVQYVRAEFRLGGMEPGLTATRGAQLYLAADSNFRTGIEGFGPVGDLYPRDNEYDRAYGSMGIKIPLGSTLFYPRLSGGYGHDMDQISAWKIGGNLINVDPFAYTLHGYYTRELFASDYVLGNLAWSFPICPEHGVTGNLYGDWALIKPPPPQADDWNNYFGVGAAVGFYLPWRVEALLGYGYGFEAVRNGQRGGDEVSFALEKKF
jgi:hypothetical protein